MLTLTLLIPYVPYMTVGALAAAIGGVVLLGSNSTTWKQTEAARGERTDARRHDRAVGDSPGGRAPDAALTDARAPPLRRYETLLKAAP